MERKMKTLLTKKARNQLVKDKDTKSIILLYELERKSYPDSFYQNGYEIDKLSYLQQEVLREHIKNGLTLGLPAEFVEELKDKLCIRV